MKKIVEYRLTHLSNWGALQVNVLQYIEEGWQPIGGVSAYIDRAGNTHYVQALVKYDNIEKD